MKVVVSLSGGGGRGAFHAGVLQAIEESDLEIEAIAATSIGAIVASSYASGVAPKRIAEILASKKFMRGARFNYFKKGLLRMKEQDEIYKELVLKERIEELEIPLFISVTNIESGVTEYISQGEIVPYCIASSSLFPLFRPVTVNGTLYIDGGFMQNLSIEPLKSFNLPILCVNLYVFEALRKKTFFALLVQALFISWNSLVYKEIKTCALCIGGKEVLRKISLYSFKDSLKAFDLGYECAKSQIDQFLQQSA